jgi:glycosyltransferase involved in cell wall biosynthesis
MTVSAGRESQPVLSVIMPVYNEARTLRTIVTRVLAAPVDADIELICVDDCSSDRSMEVLSELAAADPRIKVISQPVNMGKGKAIRTAITAMTGDVAIIQDADLEYDPEDYARVIGPILAGRADAVYGSRFAASEVRRVLFFWHALGNRVLTMFSNMANDLNLTDMETCYKAVRGDILKRLRLTSDRFGFEPEITARLAQWGARIYEVPISYHGRTYAEGKNIGWRDGVEALWLIARFRFLDTRATDDDSVVIRQAIGRAPRFRRWTIDRFRDHLGQRVLEVNAGPGHTTSHLLDRERLVVSDSEAVHVETLRRRFGHMANVEVMAVDFEEGRCELQGLDTAIVFDGLQRSVEPKQLLAAVTSCLDSGGKVLIQVPADPRLFGPTDEAAGHLRRFERDDIEDLIRAVGLELIWVEPFNRLGTLGWWLHDAFGGGRISASQARAFDLMVPVARRIDRTGFGHGLSWLAVARVP